MKVLFEWAVDLYLNFSDDYALGVGIKTVNLATKDDDWGAWFELHLLVLHIKLGKLPVEVVPQ